ncbi:ABC transporter permease [Cohnella luojiensis]|uniref:ABC transporter permease n=1 Tax=Cohnella luojiensis TaxID=652876 RepID=A0A4Y8M5R5_9BACL|nr:ABC transporter permease [Cohnella luojiensis]TFE29986.1 ABC transporter permease [Cohnella luojiensis]
MHKINKLLQPLVGPIVAIFLGLLAGSIAILVAGGSIAETYSEMWKGAFGSFYFFTSTLSRATPIILIGMGAVIAFRSGFFNLGAEGQMVLGGLSAALVGLYLPGPAWFVCIAALLAGVIAGGLWSAMAGYFDVRFRVNLLITTLLLNYIATLFAGYMVAYPFKDRSGSAAMAQSAMLDSGIWLPKLFKGMAVHAGLVIAVIAVIALYVYLTKSVSGYEARMLGGNPLFAVYGGIKRTSLMITTMFASGGLAGLAGATEVLGSQYRYIDNAFSSADYAWTGIMAALLANANPLGTAVAAFFLAALQTGGMGVELNTEVPLEIGAVIQAVLILFITVKFTLSFWKRRKGRNHDGSTA